MPTEIGPELATAFSAEIRNARRVVIGTHLNPDGDALGSALAMSFYLDQLQVEHEVLCHNEPPYNLTFLPGADRIRQTPVNADFDLALVLDLDSLDRLGSTRPVFESCPRMTVIDHHVPHQSPGDVRVVDVDAPATALILAQLLHSLGTEITPQIATCLLTGIVTDTGSFRYRNTTPQALEVAARLLARGGDIVQVGEEVYHKKPLASVTLLGRALSHLRLYAQGQIAVATVSKRDFEETGAEEVYTEGIVNELLAINTVQIAALLREPRVGKIKASIRSRGEIDVASAARQFNGGGHVNAAGCTFDTDIDEAQRMLKEALERCLASS